MPSDYKHAENPMQIKKYIPDTLLIMLAPDATLVK